MNYNISLAEMDRLGRWRRALDRSGGWAVGSIEVIGGSVDAGGPAAEDNAMPIGVGVNGCIIRMQAVSTRHDGCMGAEWTYEWLRQRR